MEMNIAFRLQDRALPALPTREEAVRILLENEYGLYPDVPFTWEVTADGKPGENRLCNGTVRIDKVYMTITMHSGSHTFPVERLLHTDGTVHPFFVFMNFRSGTPDLYYPAEEIADGGFDVLSFNYEDVTADNGDFTDGIAPLLLPEGRNTPTACGKLMMWAWAAMRVLDYAATLPMLDLSRAAVIGHSRLGKTALLAGMLDTRFTFVCPNDAGCGGDALCRGSLGVTGETRDNGKTGENIRHLITHFGYWFCKKYGDFVESGIPENFDQHFLAASVAPRYIAAGAASHDIWADPESQYLSYAAASQAWENMGLPGLAVGSRFPEPGEETTQGHIGFHLREGQHFLSRHDWLAYMRFIRSKTE